MKMNKGAGFKRSRKYSIFSFVFVFLMILQFAAIPVSPVLAGPFDDTIEKAEDEYRAYISYKVLTNCLADNDRIHVNDIDNYDGPWHEGRAQDFEAGPLFGHLGDSTNVNCNGENDMDSFVRKAGFSNVEALHRHLYDISSSARDGDHYPRRAETLEGAQNGIRSYMNENAEIGFDGSIDSLSSEAQYWYWYAIFTSDDGCGGRLTKSASDTQGVESELFAEGDFYKVESNGEAERYRYAIFDEISIDALSVTEEGPDTSTTLDPLCSSIAAELTNARATALSISMYEAAAACEAEGGTGCYGETTSLDDPTDEEGGADAGPVESCESRNVGFMGWILCQLMRGTIAVVDGFTRWFIDILDFRLENTQQEVLQAIWQGFRIIANVGFVIVFLVVIYSAATGNLLNSYDVKKMLPRVLLGAIAVQLSFFITIELLSLFNSIGQGAGDLILAPLRNVADGSRVAAEIAAQPWEGIAAEAGALVASILIVVGLIIAAIFSLGGLLLMSIVFLLRNAAVMVLIVLSPVAFVLWVLPSTEDMFKKWWKFFIQLLMFYPIATVFLASGQLIGAVWIAGAGESGFTANNAAAHIFGIIAIYAPYFIAPKMFTLAGGAIASISGAVDNTKKQLGEKSGASGAFSRAKQRGLTTAKGSAANRFNKYAEKKPDATGRFGVGAVRNTSRRAASWASKTKTGTRTLGGAVYGQEKLDQEEKAAAAVLLDQATAGMDNKAKGKHLRGIVNNSKASSGQQRAAMEQMLIENDIHGIETALANGTVDQATWQSFMREKGKDVHAKAMHLSQGNFKDGKFQAGSKSVAGKSAEAISGLHHKTIEATLADLSSQAADPTNPGQADARAALDKLLTTYQSDILSNDRLKSRLSPQTRALLDSQVSMDRPGTATSGTTSTEQSDARLETYKNLGKDRSAVKDHNGNSVNIV